MPRPRKCRRVCRRPDHDFFCPNGGSPHPPIAMTLDEYETIRLIDQQNLTQEQCATQMQVARTTVQAIYLSARRKLAQMLVEGTPLRIDGGDVLLCEHHARTGTPCGRSDCCHRVTCPPSFHHQGENNS